MLNRPAEICALLCQCGQKWRVSAEEHLGEVFLGSFHTGLIKEVTKAALGWCLCRHQSLWKWKFLVNETRVPWQTESGC